MTLMKMFCLNKPFYWSENLRPGESSIDTQTQNHVFLEFPFSILTVIFKNDDVVIYNLLILI